MHIWHLKVWSYIAATCFGIIHSILSELYTKRVKTFWITTDYKGNSHYIFSEVKNFGVKFPEDGFNDAETCSSRRAVVDVASEWFGEDGRNEQHQKERIADNEGDIRTAHVTTVSVAQ